MFTIILVEKQAATANPQSQSKHKAKHKAKAQPQPHQPNSWKPQAKPQPQKAQPQAVDAPDAENQENWSLKKEVSEEQTEL